MQRAGSSLNQKTTELLRWIVALVVAGTFLFWSWGLILLFQLARSRNLDPPTSVWSLLAIGALAVGLAAIGPTLAARILRRPNLSFLSPLASALVTLFLVVLAMAT